MECLGMIGGALETRERIFGDDWRMIDGKFGDDWRLGRASYAPVWGLDRDLLKKRHFFAKIFEITSK